MTDVDAPVQVPASSWSERHPSLAGAVWVCGLAFAAGIVATMAGFLGAKGVVLVAAAFAFVTVLLVVTKREEVILATAVLSIFALFHKSLGTQHTDVSGGPISIYVSSFDVMVLVLWFTWFVRGPREMAGQLRVAFRRPVMWAPVGAFALVLPSILPAPVTGLALAEVLRMAAAIGVFTYFAVRIRTREQIWIVLGALGAGLCIEAVVVAGQYATHSALGMSAFGTPTQLNNRFDGYDALRPFGTIVHPVFLGAFVAPCALMAYSLAANLRSTRVRLACVAVAAIGVTPILFANARSATFGIVAAFAALTVAFVVTGRLTPRVLGRSLVVLVVLAAVGYPLWSGYLQRSFENRSGGRSTRTATCTRAVDAATTCSSHFSFEWRARMQLDHLGVQVWEQEPFAGQGLNNFEQVMAHFDTYGLIFTDAPVHNLYLLQLAESGLIGLAGLLVLGVPLFLLSMRLARSKDRLFSAVGFGVVGLFVFFAVEEMLEFSLRQEQPRALFFMFCGLAVACSRLAGLDRPRPVLRARRLPLPPHTNGDRPVDISRPVAIVTDRGRGRFRRSAAGGSNGTRSRASVRARRGRHEAARTRHRMRPTRAQRLLTARRRRKQFASASIAGVLMAVSGYGFAAGSPATPDPSVDGLRIVFAALDRTTHHRGIYVADAYGNDIQQLSPADGRDYSWPTWADNGQRITYTATGDGPAEPVYMADADGGNAHPITANPWRNAQPHVAADGRSMIFTSFWNEYPNVGIYNMDLATGAVTNLSAVHSQSGAFDSDPARTADGRIVFIDAADPATGANVAGQVAVMNADGTQRRLLTHDGFYDTDPEVSPNGQDLVIARYVGPGTPHDPNSSNPYQTKLQDFVLVRHDLANGAEQQLTQGAACYQRPDSDPCSPAEGPAYIPQWTPDGNAIGYMSVLSSARTCICVVNRDGSAPRVVLESTRYAINWFSWIRPGPAPAGAILDPRPQGELTPKRMVVSGVSRDGTPVVVETTPDRFGNQPLPVPASLGAGSATLAPDRSELWFDGAAPYDPGNVQYGPAPPPGAGRTRHYTLGFLEQYYRDPPPERADAAQRQVWSVALSPPGAPVQRTTVGTEDYRDAIPDGEVRGNVTPAVSPNGRYVLFANVSTVNAESFILRYDRRTGEVLNLTNATAGAVPVADAQPAWSPDSKHVAFASRGLDGMQIWVMDADGYHAHKLTDDDYVDMMPTWSPDGRFVVYASYRGTGDPSTAGNLPVAAAKGGVDLTNWVLVRVDVATGAQTIIVQSAQSPMFKPVYDPDGSKIYYIGISGPPLQSDVYVVDATGGVARPLQVTTQTFETGVDIR